MQDECATCHSVNRLVEESCGGERDQLITPSHSSTTPAVHFTQYSLSREFLDDWSLQSFVLLTLRFWQEDNTRGNSEKNILIKFGATAPQRY